MRNLTATTLLVVLQFVSTSLGNTIRPNGIVVHHTALTKQDVLQYPGSVTIETIDSIHEKRGFRVFYWGKIYHVGYHYLILPNGLLQSGRPERCVGAHTQGNNSMIGICLVGNFSSRANPQEDSRNSEPTEAQMRALAALIQDLSARYKIPCEEIYRHDDLNPKTLCPGDRFPWKDLQTRIGCETQKRQ
jgi:hypothetical protein